MSPRLSDHEGHVPSASQLLSEQLSLGKARRLEEKAWSLVPSMFEGLVRTRRPALMEIACSEDSLLSQQIQQLKGDSEAAVRCSFFNGCNLETDSGVRLILQRLELERPAQVWISPPSGPYSPLQNNNSRDEVQQRELQTKRDQAMRAYVGACIVVRACLQQGIHVSLELPERCQAWRLPILHQLQERCSLFQAVCKGCRVGMRDRKGVLMQKGWKILTTHRRLADSLNLPCRCPPHTKHGQCTGSSAGQTEHYTQEFVQRAAKGILQELDFVSLAQEVQGRGEGSLPKSFGQGLCCQCSEVNLPQRPLTEVEDFSSEEFRVSRDSGWDEALGSFANEVEEASSRALKAQDFSHGTCEAIVEQIPCRPHEGHRGILDPQSQRYLIFGAYSHGKHYGVTRRTQNFPQTLKYLLSYMQYWSPETIIGTSLAVNFIVNVPYIETSTMMATNPTPS